MLEAELLRKGFGRISVKKLIPAVLLAFVCIGTSNISLAQATADNTMSSMKSSNSQSDLRINMRKLWEDHITYTRNYIISALADLGDADAVAKRLLKNQDDIGNAIIPYYGNDAGNKLALLLKDHILIAVDLIKAAKANMKDDLSKAQAKWKKNADDIAAFLSTANPNWSKSDVTDILYKHLDLTTGEVVSRLKKDWDGDIDSYDKGHTHMLLFSDTLTNGIAKQFPDKFTN